MMKCMRDNDAKLSSACKDEHAKMMGKMAELKAACQTDMDTYCKDVKKGDHHALDSLIASIMRTVCLPGLLPPPCDCQCSLAHS